jgi:hypothetical protein
MRLDELEDFDEVVAKFVSTLRPEQRLAGLAPEERLAGLAQPELILALRDDVLRGLSAEFIESLPEDVRDRLRARLAG